jgi:hypothetical protein
MVPEHLRVEHQGLKVTIPRSLNHHMPPTAAAPAAAAAAVPILAAVFSCFVVRWVTIEEV